MAGQIYTTEAARIGQINGRILKRAMNKERLGRVGAQEHIPKKSGDTIVFRRWYLIDGQDNYWVAGGQDDEFVARHLTTEGQTPDAENITAIDITVILQQYSCLFSYSDKVGKMYEDEVPPEQERQAGERIALVRELQAYGKLKAGTNSFFGGTGTNRSTVNGTISVNKLRKIRRDLRRYYAEPVTEMLGTGPDYGSVPVGEGYPAYCHTDLEPDIRDLEGFKSVEEYAEPGKRFPGECGACEGFRFILSPALVEYTDAGATAAGTGLVTSGTKVDVFPVIFVGDDSFAQVALRGEEAVQANHIPYNQPSKSDPGGQRGYVWAGCWYNAGVMNQDWMAVGEFGIMDL